MAPNDPINRFAAGSPARAGQASAESPAARLLRLWQDGSAPDLDVFLAESGDLPPVELAAVLRVDQRERWRLGQYIPAETYLHRCPRLRDHEEGAADLVYGEFLLRERRGAAPPVEEFLWRFPNLASVLVPQIELHRALQAAPALAAEATATLTNGLPALAEPETVIGPFKLLEQIGEGSFGAVFRAEQSQPVRREVALKVLKPGMDTRSVVARFEAERQALAIMDHPNIARVFDGGETASGRPYFVMELVNGVPITDYCDRNRLTPQQRLELFITVCQAVQHAHQKGIIHRDLKPSNVLVATHDAAPVPKIIDFGIAKALGQELTDKTLYSVCALMVGTPLYMSPEQAGVSGLDVDTRSDIYSLGVLLYELLTGTTPFDKERLRAASYDEFRRIITEEEHARPSTRLSTLGQTVTTVATNRATEPPRLSKLVRGDLDWIVMKALEKDRTRRYETANGFAADVQRYLADEPVLACPPSVGYRLRKLVRRHKGPVLAASLLGLALVAGIIGTTWGMLRATDAKADAVNEAKLKESALQDAKNSLWHSLYEQARARRFSRQLGQRLDSLDALAKAAAIRPDERLRDEAIAALALPDVHSGPSLQLGPAWADLKTFDFDGPYETYARLDGPGVISIRRVPGDEEIRRIETRNRVAAGGLFLSPNGQFLAVIDEQRAVQLWRVADDKPLLGEALGPCVSVAFSPDSRQVAVAVGDSVVTLDVAGGRETARWRLPSGARTLAFHPDNRRLAVGFDHNSVASIYDSAAGSHVADLPVGAMTGQVVAWHPDGDRLAVAGSDPLIQIWDVAGRQRLALLEGHTWKVTHLTFHPDGSLLASASWDGVVRLWDPGTGQQLMQLPLESYPRFASTGRWLGFQGLGDGRVQLLGVTTAREYRTIVSSLGAGQGHYHEGDISPDGRLLALGMAGSSDRLWDLSSGRELAVLPSQSNCVLFQPDGRELLTCGPTGLHRWPVQERPDVAHALRLGPPRQLPLPSLPTRAARSPDGRTLAVLCETTGTGLILDLTTASMRGRPFEHPRACWVALSGDGRWVATSGWRSDRVRLWDAATGAMAREWVLGMRSNVAFTPDSRALIICRDDEISFWDVGTAKLIRRLRRDVAHYPGDVIFSPDGKLMALELAPAVINLMEVATGRTVAKLEDPHGDRPRWKCFTPDGTQLVVVALHARAIHVWDLRVIRQRLKGMGLDWDWPEFPPADPVSKTAPPPKVEVRLGDLAQFALSREEKARQAIEQYRRAVDANPDDAGTCNNLAWFYATAPESLRDAEAAVALAEKAVRLDPSSATNGNTLGVAYYRAGRHREAVGVLRANIDKQEDAVLAFDLYFLAMSHHRLDDHARARAYYDWAVRWSRTHKGRSPGDVEELDIFRAEASEVLGVVVNGGAEIAPPPRAKQ